MMELQKSQDSVTRLGWAQHCDIALQVDLGHAHNATPLMSMVSAFLTGTNVPASAANLADAQETHYRVISLDPLLWY